MQGGLGSPRQEADVGASRQREVVAEAVTETQVVALQLEPSADDLRTEVQEAMGTRKQSQEAATQVAPGAPPSSSWQGAPSGRVAAGPRAEGEVRLLWA